MEKGKAKIKAVIFLISIMLQSMNSVALVLSGVAKEFTDASTTSVQLVYTLIFLMSVVGMLITGKLASLMTKKKIVIIFSILLMVGGILGYFMSMNIPLLYISSIFIGIGNGVLLPIASSLIAEYFQGGERASVNGLQSLFIGGGGMLFNIFGGILAAQNWRSLYLLYIIALPIILSTLFLLPEGRIETREEGVKVKIFTPYIILLSLQSLIFGIAWMTLFSNITYYVFDLGIGNESQASFITIAYSIGSVVMGLMLRFIMKWTGKYCFVTAFAISTIGLWLLCFANSLLLLILCGVLLGFAFGLFMPSGYTLIPNNVHPAAITMSIAFFTACFSLGGFLNPYIVTLSAGTFSNEISARFLVAAIIMTIDLLFCLISTLKMKEAKTQLD